MKAAIDISLLGHEGFLEYAQGCGAVLARAHARAADASTIAGYLGDGPQFDEALAGFAIAYSRINEGDHDALVERAALTE
ncbi:MAG: DUF2252 domain-containing protein [Actinomycetales bacterium]|nr:DUF2252 domain-containing protein [Actinomycetales bacterium]